MLALTECHANKHGAVKALVLGKPVVDWTAMYPIASSVAEDLTPAEDEAQAVGNSPKATHPKSRKKEPAPVDSWLAHASSPLLSASTLLQARDTLFAKPEHYHDPFASPLLFFRSASSDIPPPEYTFSHHFPDSVSSAPSLSQAAVTTFLKPRRAYMRYPPPGSALVLPRTRVDVGRESVLRDQGVELAEAMGRSWALYGGQGAGRGKGAGAERGDGHGEDVVNVEVREVEGEGLWGEEELVGVGRLVAETLGSRA